MKSVDVGLMLEWLIFIGLMSVALIVFISLDEEINSHRRPPVMLLNSKLNEKQVFPIGTKVLIEFIPEKSVLITPDSAKGKMPVDLCPKVVRVGPDCKKTMKDGDFVMVGRGAEANYDVVDEHKFLIDECFILAIVK